MCLYSWPGNVRELENAVMRSIAMAGASDRLDERYLLQTPAGMQPNAGSMNIPTLGGTMLSPQSNHGESSRAQRVPSAESPDVPPPAERAVPAAHAVDAVKKSDSDFKPLRDIVGVAEREYIQTVLLHTGGNKTRAAALMDISRKNLWEKMRDYGLL